MFDEQGRADVWVVGEGVGEKMVSWDLSILVVARVCLSLSLSKFSYAQQYQIIYSPAPCCAFTKIRRRQFQAEKSSSTLRTFKSPNQQRGARSLNLEKFDTQSSEPKVQQRRLTNTSSALEVKFEITSSKPKARKYKFLSKSSNVQVGKQEFET